jgi:hypothetical protein
MPKHEGQAMVASLASQYEQWTDSVAAAAPHMGQLRVSAIIFAGSLFGIIGPMKRA